MKLIRIWSILAAFCLVSAGLYGQQDKATPQSKMVVPSWAKTNTNGEPVFTNPMEMPRFPGCEELAKEERYPCSINKLVAFISDKVIYPESARAEKVEGTVIVEFIVDTKGNVTEAKVKQSVSASLDAEALRVINSMPRWIPGREEGTIVNSFMTFPIKFALDADDKE